MVMGCILRLFGLKVKPQKEQRVARDVRHGGLSGFWIRPLSPNVRYDVAHHRVKVSRSRVGDPLPVINAVFPRPELEHSNNVL